MKKKYSDILWIAGGQLFGLLSNFLLLKILTSNLGMSDYGYYTLFMAVLLFTRQVTYDPFSVIAAKETVTKNIIGSSNYCIFQITRYATDTFFIFLIFFIVMVLFISRLFFDIPHLSVWLAFGVIYLGSNGAQGVYLNILNTLEERKWAAIGITLDSFVKLILVITIFTFFHNSVVLTIQGIAFSSFLVFLWTRHIGKRFSSLVPMNKDQKLASAKSLFLLSLPLFAPSLLTSIKGSGDKVLMALFIGVDELAAYNVLLQIGFIPMVMVVGVIQTYSSPHIYKLIASNSDLKEVIPYVVKIIFRILIFTAIAISVSSVLSEVIFRILVGGEYFKYSHYLPYFVLAGALSGISGLLNISVIGAFNTKTIGLIMLVSVITGLLLLIGSLGIYGFEGGVAGLIVSNLSMILIFGCSLMLFKIINNT